jgi:hypothetical protein
MNKTTKMTHDELIAMVMADYTERLAREEAYRQDVRSGKITPVQTTTWNISDRH